MSQCLSAANEVVGGEPILLVRDTVPLKRAFQAVRAPLAPTSVLVTGPGCREFAGTAGGHWLGLSCAVFSPVHPP